MTTININITLADSLFNEIKEIFAGKEARNSVEISFTTDMSKEAACSLAYQYIKSTAEQFNANTNGFKNMRVIIDGPTTSITVTNKQRAVQSRRAPVNAAPAQTDAFEVVHNFLADDTETAGRFFHITFALLNNSQNLTEEDIKFFKYGRNLRGRFERIAEFIRTAFTEQQLVEAGANAYAIEKKLAKQK